VLDLVPRIGLELADAEGDLLILLIDAEHVAIFKTPTAIDQFLLTTIDGQRGGLDVDANFSAGSGGTIRSFNPEITFYTVGLSGYDLQANYGGTLYLVDQQLNNAATLNSLPKKK
jgi:hypothetical protein